MTSRSNKISSFNSNDIIALCERAMGDWESLFQKLGITEYTTWDNRINGTCPIHLGDNISAFNIYLHSGQWKCFSHGCHNIFQPSLVGLVRGVLSRQKYNWSDKSDKYVTFEEGLEFLIKFCETLDKNNNGHVVSDSSYQKQFFNQISQYYQQANCNTVITRQQVRNTLDIPSQYYLDRGYSKDVLDRYDIGTCHIPNKTMYQRAVVPVYDETHRYMVGCTGRTINNLKPKWIHSKGFRAGEYLYNIWNAKKHILKSKICILVESPGNVWKLEENGIHNSLAIFGTNFSFRQKCILDSLGILSLIVLLDNDIAGLKAAKQIKKECSRMYRLFFPKFEANDIAELSPDEITRDVRPYLEKAYQCHE